MLQKCIRGYKNIAKMHPQASIVAKILQKCIRCCKRSKMRPHNKVRDASARVTIRSRKTMQVRPRNQCERLSARATIRSRSLCVSDDTIEENLAGGTTYPKWNDRGNSGPIMLLIMLLDHVAWSCYLIMLLDRYGTNQLHETIKSLNRSIPLPICQLNWQVNASLLI